MTIAEVSRHLADLLFPWYMDHEDVRTPLMGTVQETWMKITAVEGFPVKIGHRNQFVVKIETDEGIHGVGEGGISGRELAMNGMLQHFERALIG